MKRSIGLLAIAASCIALLGTSHGYGQGIDRIKRRNGTDSGKITKITQLSVTMSRGGVEREIPVEEIVSVTFAGEPSDLRSARLAASGGRFNDALESLSQIAREQIDRDELKQELDFLSAACTAKLAIAGQGDIAPAQAAVAKFLSQNRDSFHLSEAIELAGDLHLAAGNFAEAQKEYTKLSKAPSPFHKARSALLIGRLLQQQAKHTEALAEFENAVAAAGDDTAAKSQLVEATLLSAVSRSAGGELASSTEDVKKIIADADPEDTQLLARAYNALGDCYLLGKNPKAARDAFLHVDLLFASASSDHAKALYELSQLWSTLGQETRATDAKERLKQEYPSSPWANR